MATDKHIERIGDTIANIRTNIDKLQIAISTDDQESLLWSNNANNKLKYAAIQKHWNGTAFVYEDNDFGNVTIREDLYVDQLIKRRGGNDDSIELVDGRVSINVGGAESFYVLDNGNVHIPNGTLNLNTGIGVNQFSDVVDMSGGATVVPNAPAVKSYVDGLLANAPNWNNAFTHSQIVTGNPHQISYTDLTGSPSDRITAGNFLSWSGDTLNVSDSWYNSFTDLPVAAPTDGDTTHVSSADQIHDFVTSQISSSVFWNRIGSKLSPKTMTDSIELVKTTSTTTGVIYKGTDPFIHDFSHPTGNTAIPVGRNVFIGGAGNFTAGSAATSISHASYNFGAGYQSLASLYLGSYNFGGGYQTLFSLTNGSYNFAGGFQALYNLTTGSYNFAGGSRCLFSLTSGTNNFTGGKEALYFLTTGGYNFGGGTQSLYYLTTGNENVACGYYAGAVLANGSTHNTISNYGTFIGSRTKALVNNGTNETVIGFNAIGAGSNSVVLGSDAVITTLLKGNVGLGKTPDYKFHVYGNDANIVCQSVDSVHGTTLGLYKGIGALPGYATNYFPTIKTNYSFIYFSANGKYTGHIGSNSAGNSVFGLEDTESGLSTKVSLNTKGNSWFTGGNVGYGTSTPNHLVHVYDGDVVVESSDTNFGTKLGLYKTIGALPGYATNYFPVVKTDFSSIFFSCSAKQSGYIGSDSSGHSTFGLYDTGLTTSPVVFRTDGDSCINGGNLGMGTIDPLDSFSSTTYTGLEINADSKTNGGSVILLSSQGLGANGFPAGYKGGALYFKGTLGATNNEIMGLVGGGNVLTISAFNDNFTERVRVADFLSTEIDFKLNVDVGEKNIQGTFIDLADDIASNFTPGNPHGTIIIACQKTGIGAIVNYGDNAGTATIMILSETGQFAVSTTALTNGTTNGTDGKFNISFTGGKLYFKNRLGST